MNFKDDPFEDIYKSFDEFDTSSMRAGIILLSSIVEYFLGEIIISYLYGKDSAYCGIIESCGISTLSKKIKFAKTLKLINEETYRYLHALRNTRNFFAHHFEASAEQPYINKYYNEMKAILPVEDYAIGFCFFTSRYLWHQ